jgi:phosphatidylglycerophosphatase B
VFVILSLIVLCLSLSSYLFDFYWFTLVSENRSFGFMLHLLTSTASIYVLPIFAIVFSFFYGKSWQARVNTLVQFIFLLALTIVTILALKKAVNEERPFIHYLLENNLIQQKVLQSEERQVKLSQVIASLTSIPDWQKQHWVNESRSSFPSGHASFAFLFALFFGQLFLKRGNKLIAMVLLTWAVAIAYTRLLLGVHWPQDVIAGAIVGLFFAKLDFKGILFKLNISPLLFSKK